MINEIILIFSFVCFNGLCMFFLNVLIDCVHILRLIVFALIATTFPLHPEAIHFSTFFKHYGQKARSDIKTNLQTMAVS